MRMGVGWGGGGGGGETGMSCLNMVTSEFFFLSKYGDFAAFFPKNLCTLHNGFFLVATVLRQKK